MTDNSQLYEFISDQIGRLRPRLLDFSRRNPLVATRLSERSASTVRVVDEIPTEIFQRLATGRMTLASLPPLEDDPKDEQTEVFKSELAKAYLTDPTYNDELIQIEEDADDEAAERLIIIERDLKDRVRESLGMAPRQSKSSFSLKDHARNNEINSSYELPLTEDIAEDGRHTDDLIQTLLLPDVFSRRLDAISTKCRTFLQETGIDVLRVAFGFLEWSDTEKGTASFAPLLLMPAKLVKERKPSGPEYTISGDESLESNVVIAEKFRIEFSMDFPAYEPGMSIEEYFQLVAEAAPPGRRWKVRRQIAVGVFPSSRMAMYQDLAPDNWNYGEHGITQALFGGADSSAGASAFGDEYEVDRPEIEAKVPHLITEADSSQFSTIVDVMDGKNLAVEGPPGTGKSQTIVNTIAAALASKKKVLFVAEKTAALDVVRSRLEAFGLGEFILPLMATRSGRSEVMQSVRERVEMGRPQDVFELDEQIEKFDKTRSSLQDYVDVIGHPFGSTGLKVFDILGRQIKYREELFRWPIELHNNVWPGIEKLTDAHLQELCHVAEEIAQTEVTAREGLSYWQGIGVKNLDHYRVGEVLSLASACSNAFQHLCEVRSGLEAFGISSNYNFDGLSELCDLINELGTEVESVTAGCALSIFEQDAYDDIERFIDEVDIAVAEKRELSESCQFPLDEKLPEQLTTISALMHAIGVSKVSREQLVSIVEDRNKQLADGEKIIGFISQVVEVCPEASSVSVGSLMQACALVKALSVEALALRAKDIDDPLAWDVLEKAKLKIDELSQREEELKKSVSIDKFKHSRDQLNRHIESLSDAGFWGFMSSDVRSAKKFYKMLSKRSGFSKDTALSDLHKLSDLLKEKDEFNQDRKLERLLGLKFDGVDTDFSRVNEVVGFYRTLDEVLSGPSCMSFKDFLRHENYERIRSLPNPVDAEIGSLSEVVASDLINRVEHLRSSQDKLKSDLASLNGLLPVLVSAEGMTDISFAELSKKVQKFQISWGNLSDRDEVRRVIEDAFKGPETDPDVLDEALTVASEAFALSEGLGQAYLEALSGRRISELVEVLRRIRDSHNEAETALSAVARNVEVEEDDLIGDMPEPEIVEWMSGASQDRDGLVLNSRLAGGKQKLRDEGLGFILDILEQHDHSFEDLDTGLRALAANAMARAVFSEYGDVLARNDGHHLDGLRARLVDLDKKIIELSRHRLRSQLIRSARPPMGNGRGKKSSYTELSLIEHQVGLKRPNRSPRELTKRAGRALLELKPCWMMSPLAVAQYIEKGSVEFDLVIIDEASQMTPENAIGALMRGSQVMIVGDTNQLPPTNFFRKMIVSDEEEGDEDEITEESILERANTAFKPLRRLRWHYRSRHSSLIALSNNHIYDDHLIVFPSPTENDPTMGVELVEVDGVYSSGTNPKEASAMIEHIIRFMMTQPDMSLGVVTINQKQRDLLLEEFEYALSQNPSLNRYIEAWEERNYGLESFFIKNLENVQGDERDVIFIGTVYGPESAEAKVHQRFGPITGKAGRRRLNVLFSRAKMKVVTFSSLKPTDIRAEESSNAGAYMLKRWLEYSKTGILHAGKTDLREPDSDFEEYVIEQIKAMGCEPVPQVGVSGYYIDIGVRHPSWPYGFILGVECDGATYHSSKSARDRDRYRQEVLEGLGWKFHRIWSTDWFESPAKEADRLREVIRERLEELKSMESCMSPSFDELDADIPDTQLSEELDQAVNAEYETVSKLNRNDIGIEKARQLLIDLRDDEILDEFPDSNPDRNILRDTMIDAFLKYRPIDKSDFRNLIPLSLREDIDLRHMKYLDFILETIERIEV
ncbi:DUF4011 domain-containing protein [Terasakiella pusilla]|uniref:DUF4011 domain-containing protein n=1 Tax=Terasakiella pusilla TaxID=64973 RepID=UPI003AA92614